MRNILLINLFIFVAAMANAAEPILGNWKTKAGDIATATNCTNNYCLTLKDGKYAGKQIGILSGTDAHYSGTITDPTDNKTYTGYAAVEGNTLKLQGCVMKIFCKSQNWSRVSAN